MLELADHFVKMYAKANGMVRVLSTEARAQLIANRWPGNVRELENAMHRAVLIAPGEAIGPESIIAPDGARLEEQRAAPAVAHATFAAEAVTRALVGRTVADVERDLILETLKHCLGNRTHAANILGISIRTLRNKLNEYAGDGVNVPPPGSGGEFGNTFGTRCGQRRNGACLVEPEISIELQRQRGVEIMARELCLGPVDHTDRAFEPRIHQAFAQVSRAAFLQIDQKASDAAVAAQALVTVAMRGAHLLDLHRPVPVGCCRDGTAVGAESDQRRLRAELLPAQLTDVEFAAHLTHFSRRRVADVRVVGPHHGLCILATPRQKLLQRLEHVTVTQIPGFRRPVIHDSVVALGAGDQARVLCCIEETLTLADRNIDLFLEQLT